MTKSKKTTGLQIDDANELNETLLMYDISRLTRRNFERRAKSLGLTRSQWMVIGIVRRFPGIKQAELAERMDVQPITVGRLIDRMEKDGWIERRSDPNDRRAKRLHLTSRVQAIASQIRSLALNIRKDTLEGLTQNEHDTLLRILTLIKNNLCSRA